ncbi:hypothetical protein DFH08DRAFT_954688 [Mycena albidolilacea]|uniref:Uncharacterized protein n=1 Tax=Mycena albidolilacea TaxID=1033008 RepID=A0AAD7EX76_9AGAR|nr:hypothetical protein DFH08DRAFT_954688 [Mycena albidolilacea]
MFVCFTSEECCDVSFVNRFDFGKIPAPACPLAVARWPFSAWLCYPAPPKVAIPPPTTLPNFFGECFEMNHVVVLPTSAVRTILFDRLQPFPKSPPAFSALFPPTFPLVCLLSCLHLLPAPSHPPSAALCPPAPLPASRFPLPASRFLLPAFPPSRFPPPFHPAFLASHLLCLRAFPLPASRFPLPASRFPLPASRPPLPAPRFPPPALPPSRFPPSFHPAFLAASRLPTPCLPAFPAPFSPLLATSTFARPTCCAIRCCFYSYILPVDER